MTLEQLRIFVAVAEAPSMTRAAEMLHLTQPAASAAVAALEGRHAARLFDRVGRRLELSAAGRIFLPEAKAVLARADAARRVLADLAGLERGEVRIVASQTVATYWLPAVLARFAAAHPGIALPLAVGNSAGAAAAVSDGRADLGFVEAEVTDDQLRVQAIGGDRLGLYAAPGHRLAERLLAAGDLRTATWVLREPGSGTRDHFTAALAAQGIAAAELSVRLEMPSNGAVLAAVEDGELVTAVSDLAAAPRVAVGRVVRLDWALPARAFSLVTHRARHPSRAAAALVDSLDVSAR